MHTSARWILSLATLGVCAASAASQTIDTKSYYWDKRLGCSQAYAHAGFQADTHVEDMRLIQTSGFYRRLGELRERLKISGWAQAKGYLFGWKKEGFRFDGAMTMAEGIAGQNRSYYVSYATTSSFATGFARFSVAGNTLLNHGFSATTSFSKPIKRFKMFGLIYSTYVGPVPMSVDFDVDGVADVSGYANVLWSGTPRAQLNAGVGGYIDGDGRVGVGIAGVVGFGMGLRCKLIDSDVSVNCEASSVNHHGTLRLSTTPISLSFYLWAQMVARYSRTIFSWSTSSKSYTFNLF